MGLETSDAVRALDRLVGVASVLFPGIDMGGVFGDCIESMTESSRALAFEAKELGCD